MTVHLSRLLHDRLMALAQDDSAREICGLLMGEADRISDIHPATNVATDPSRRFEIDPAVLLRAHRVMRQGGPRIIGHYHSHPTGDAAPSITDAAQAVADGQIWIIIASGQMRAWQAGTDGLHGRFTERQLIVTGPEPVA